MTDKQPNPNIQKGMMPVPRYFESKELKGVNKLVGIEAHTIDGGIKTFIFFRNFVKYL